MLPPAHMAWRQASVISLPGLWYESYGGQAPAHSLTSWPNQGLSLFVWNPEQVRTILVELTLHHTRTECGSGSKAWCEWASRQAPSENTSSI